MSEFSDDKAGRKRYSITQKQGSDVTAVYIDGELIDTTEERVEVRTGNKGDFEQ